jgi:glycosyltransferase involved in cell wall biosynthesis
MRARGIDLTVACLDELGFFGEGLKREGFSCHQLGRQPGFDFALPGRIAALAKSERVDVIHAHQYTPFFYGVMARRKAGVPLLFTEHGRFYPDLPSWKRRLFNRLIGCRVDHTTAVSDAVKEALVAIEGMPSAPIEVLHNGIDLGRFSVPTGARDWLAETHGVPMDAPVVGTVARLNPIKNQAMLVDAFAQARQVVPDAHLAIVGDGSERQALQTQVADLGLNAAVHFLGERDDVARMLGAMDVFALSSLSEGMPMTLLEAMAARVPIATTDVGGISQMLEPGREALFCASDDTAAFSANLVRLLSNPEVCEELTARAHARVVDDFSLDVIGERYLHIYRALARLAQG